MASRYHRSERSTSNKMVAVGLAPAEPSVLLEHHFGRLDHDLDGVTLLERHGFGTSSGDHALNEVFPHAYHDMCHYSTELKLLDGSC